MENGAERSIEELDGAKFLGRRLRVNESRPKPRS